eukprot:scaffold31385_cov62-Phaeocystis_antarctica.AAC.3
MDRRAVADSLPLFAVVGFDKGAHIGDEGLLREGSFLVEEVVDRPLLLAAVRRGRHHSARRHRPELGRARQAERALGQRGDAQGVPG